MKPRVVIVGGGFAGLWSARTLAKRARADRLDVTLVNPRPTSDFHPLLPDVVGGRVRRTSATYNLRRAEQRWALRFRQAEATAVDADRRVVVTTNGDVPFDHVIVATGALTNFRGRDDFRPHAFTLESARDAESMIAAARDRSGAFVVAGGGPTGVELATNLRLRCWPRRPRIVLAEFLPRLCSLLPESHGRYVLRNVRRMGIDVRLGTTVETVDGSTVALSDGERIAGARLIWAAGVAPGAVARELPRGDRNGRAATDEYLQAGEGIWAAGDAAGFVRPGESQPIRMSVQHAIGGGVAAARNVLNAIDGRDLQPFRPLDLGYIVPMANGRSCGTAMGVPVFGAPATALHYVMSGFRSQAPAKTAGVLTDALASYLDARRFNSSRSSDG
jgi:NADH dehydrogenase